MRLAVLCAFAVLVLGSGARAEEPREEPAEEAPAPRPKGKKSGLTVDLLRHTRVVGVGENLGRDKKATVLNYTLYGGRTYQADGRPTLVLHKIERTSPKTGLFSTDDNIRNSFIISYQYVQPDVIYLQGAWMKILEFDNTRLKFVVLTDRRPISPE